MGEQDGGSGGDFFLRSTAPKGLFVGIFADEAAVLLLSYLEAEAQRCLGELMQSARREGGATAVPRALQSIDLWTAAIVEQEAQAALRAQPQLDALYRQTMLAYVRSVYRPTQGRAQVQVRLPPFRDFLYLFFKALARHPFVAQTSAIYLDTARVFERKVVHMDAIRLALADCARGRVQAREGALAATPIVPSAMAPAAVRATEQALAAAPPDIGPSDSASQVGAPRWAAVGATHSPGVAAPDAGNMPAMPPTPVSAPRASVLEWVRSSSTANNSAVPPTAAVASVSRRAPSAFAKAMRARLPTTRINAEADPLAARAVEPLKDPTAADSTTKTPLKKTGDRSKSAKRQKSATPQRSRPMQARGEIVAGRTNRESPCHASPRDTPAAIDEVTCRGNAGVMPRNASAHAPAQTSTGAEQQAPNAESLKAPRATNTSRQPRLRSSSMSAETQRPGPADEANAEGPIQSSSSAPENATWVRHVNMRRAILQSSLHMAGDNASEGASAEPVHAPVPPVESSASAAVFGQAATPDWTPTARKKSHKAVDAPTSHAATPLAASQDMGIADDVAQCRRSASDEMQLKQADGDEHGAPDMPLHADCTRDGDASRKGAVLGDMSRSEGVRDRAEESKLSVRAPSIGVHRYRMSEVAAHLEHNLSSTSLKQGGGRTPQLSTEPARIKAAGHPAYPPDEPMRVKSPREKASCGTPSHDTAARPSEIEEPEPGAASLALPALEGSALRFFSGQRTPSDEEDEDSEAEAAAERRELLQFARASALTSPEPTGFREADFAGDDFDEGHDDTVLSDFAPQDRERDVEE